MTEEERIDATKDVIEEINQRNMMKSIAPHTSKKGSIQDAVHTLCGLRNEVRSLNYLFSFSHNARLIYILA